MRIIYVPIEPLEERYTEQWYRVFPTEFKNEGFEVLTIDGLVLNNKVSVGTFLDINSTVNYKNSQMMVIADMFHNNNIKDGDVFFFGDCEFWGIESLRLLSDMNNINIRIYSFLHAGSYTKGDAFEIATPYQKYTELGWVMSCDAVFVGSEYHKRTFTETRINKYAHDSDKKIMIDKIIVTGNPLFKNEYHKFNGIKKDKIVISNRFDWEKRPNLSLDFAQIIKNRHPNIDIVITTSRPEFKSNKNWLIEYARLLESKGVIRILDNLTKEEYHKELSESKIMITNSIEENFGYCIVEAIHYNTYPLCVNDLSHPELCNYDSDLLFDDNDEILDKVEYLLTCNKEITSYNNKYYIDSMKHIINVIKNK